MRQSTVCFLIKDTPDKEVCLGYKKTGFGSGKYAGIGGKVEPGETPQQAALREVAEEISVEIPANAIQFMGCVTFVFPSRESWSQEVYIYIAHQWHGEPVESDEMRPSWFCPQEIPYPSMWQDAAYWMPPVLEGTRIQARFSFKEDNETVDEIILIPQP